MIPTAPSPLTRYVLVRPRTLLWVPPPPFARRDARLRRTRQLAHRAQTRCLSWLASGWWLRFTARRCPSSPCPALLSTQRAVYAAGGDVVGDLTGTVSGVCHPAKGIWQLCFPPCWVSCPNATHRLSQTIARVHTPRDAAPKHMVGGWGATMANALVNLRGHASGVGG